MKLFATVGAVAFHSPSNDTFDDVVVHFNFVQSSFTKKLAAAQSIYLRHLVHFSQSPFTPSIELHTMSFNRSISAS